MLDIGAELVRRSSTASIRRPRADWVYVDSINPNIAIWTARCCRRLGGHPKIDLSDLDLSRRCEPAMLSAPCVPYFLLHELAHERVVRPVRHDGSDDEFCSPRSIETWSTCVRRWMPTRPSHAAMASPGCSTREWRFCLNRVLRLV